MAGSRGRWLSERLTPRSFIRPKNVAKAVFHPAWIPETVDPAVETLKRIRLVAGAIAAVGVYTFVQGGFAFDEMLQNMLTACLVLLLITPLTTGVMLYVWRRTGTVRQLRASLVNAVKLLLLFVGSVVVTVLVWMLVDGTGPLLLLLGLPAIWLTGFVGAGAVRVSGNFFGTAAVHRCLPPLLATVTTWLMAIPDLATGDLHGLSLTMGFVFILGAPLTVTGIALLEMNRLRRRYGIRLGAHPSTLPPLPPPPPPYSPSGHPPPPGSPQGSPYGSPYGNPYGSPYGSPYAPGPAHPHGQGAPYGYPQPPAPPYPYDPRPSYPPRNPYGPGPHAG